MLTSLQILLEAGLAKSGRIAVTQPRRVVSPLAMELCQYDTYASKCPSWQSLLMSPFAACLLPNQY